MGTQGQARLGMQIARNTPAKTPPFIPLIKGAGVYAAKPRLRREVFLGSLKCLIISKLYYKLINATAVKHYFRFAV